MKALFLRMTVIVVVVSFCVELSAQCYQSRQVMPPILASPVYAQPVYGQPVYGQPVFAQPVYSQPLVYGQNTIVSTASVPKSSTTQVANQPLSPTLNQARQLTAIAKRKFVEGDYATAMAKLNLVCKLVPQESAAFQFRSLCAFALGDCENAAADAYDALKLGNTWTKPVIHSLYGDNEKQYAIHIEDLMRKAQQDNASMQTHFLLAYHLLMSEQWQQGQKQLKKVLELKPSEPLSTKLLTAVEKKIAASK